MKKVESILLFAFASAALVACADTPDNCDLDNFHADQKILVNCVEDAAATGQFTCTCPDDSTFDSSGACDKGAIEQGALIDEGCPAPVDG